LSIDDESDVCFVLERECAGETEYSVYPDIFSSLHANWFIRKPIENEEPILAP